MTATLERYESQNIWAEIIAKNLNQAKDRLDG